MIADGKAYCDECRVNIECYAALAYALHAQVVRPGIFERFHLTRSMRIIRRG